MYYTHKKSKTSIKSHISFERKFPEPLNLTTRLGQNDYRTKKKSKK